MSQLGQQYALPQRNIGGRFSSMSGHERVVGRRPEYLLDLWFDYFKCVALQGFQFRYWPNDRTNTSSACN
jgi:hypothetical protein